MKKRILSWLSSLRSGRALLVLAVLAGLAAAGGVWRYRMTRPEYRLRLGQEAVLRGDWNEAEEQAIRLDAAGYPDHACLVRGHSFLRRGRLYEAVLEYNAIRHDHEDVLAEASLIYGLGFYSLERHAEAENFLLSALHLRPNSVEAHRGLGALYYDRGAMRQALHHLEKWSELAPGDGMPYRFMGLIYESTAAYEPAVESYRKALERKLPPTVREAAALELAEVLVKRTEFAEALALLDANGLGIGPPPAVAECRAECLCGLGRHEAAKEVLEQLPTSQFLPRALRLRAQIHVAQDEDGAAVGLLEKALQMDPHDCACRYQLALAYGKQGRRSEADEQFRLLEQSQQLLKEMSDLNQQAVERPTDAEVRKRLAELCRRLNKPQLAAMWMQAARSCNPNAKPPLQPTGP